MIKCFKYKNAKNEVATRIVNITNESETEYRGFDYNKLTQEEQSLIKKVYPDNHQPRPINPTLKGSLTLKDYEAMGISYDLYSKAYRIFKKKNIV